MSKNVSAQISAAVINRIAKPIFVSRQMSGYAKNSARDSARTVYHVGNSLYEELTEGERAEIFTAFKEVANAAQRQNKHKPRPQPGREWTRACALLQARFQATASARAGDRKHTRMHLLNTVRRNVPNAPRKL